MPFIDFNKKTRIKIFEGVTGAFYHSDQSTMGHVTLEKGTVIPEHHHIHEQWTHVLDGEMELTVNCETRLLTSGMSAYMPSDMPHAARAITECKVIDCFSPVREDFVALEKNSA